MQETGVVSEQLFRQAMGRFATGVTLITCGIADGRQPEVVGMIANAVSSVSTEPPLVLVCIHKERRIYRAIESTGRFVINVLAAHQEALSRYFARQSDEPVEPSWVAMPSGQPALEGAIAQLDCKLHAAYPGGTHTIFVGLVEHAHTQPGAPLLYYESQYTTFPEGRRQP